MYIDKIIKKEVLSLVVSVILIVLMFIGTSFASFKVEENGVNNVISIGDIEITFCADATCGSGLNYGQVIGTVSSNGETVPTPIYPYVNESDALLTTPYIFNIENTGSLKHYLDASLIEDEDFIPSGNYSQYTSATELYSDNIKIGINECPNGAVTSSGVTIYTYGDLIDGKILSNIKLEPEENKTYCLWTWLDGNTPNDAQKTYFVANLNFSAEYLPDRVWYNNCSIDSTSLRCKMITAETTYADNVSSPHVTGENGIDFGVASSSTNGLGLYYTDEVEKNDENNDGVGHRIYYYRGGVTNNFVIFAGYCFRIVRTNEDGSIRLRYGGSPTNGTCPKTGVIVSISSNSWYSSSVDNASAGYMVGTFGASSYAESHSNTTNNNVKNKVDEWYQTNILTDYSSYVQDTIYCNNRKVGAGGTVAGVTFVNENHYGTNNVIFDTTRRISVGSDIGTEYNTPTNPQPATLTFKCEQQNDRYTLSTESGGTLDYGNKKLTYPIGLLNADEVAYSGGEHSVNSTTYLNIGQTYWLMSPMRIGNGTNSRIYTVKTGGQLNVLIGTSSAYVLPVISLIPNIEVSGGNGNFDNPYIIN